VRFEAPKKGPMPSVDHAAELQECMRLEHSSVIMPTANSSASKEAVTAALLVIGGKILSGRTKDQNIGYIAEHLTAVGIDLKEARVVGDEEGAIVDALNALRHRYSYVFTTGGIGPTHGDIIADCVAKAFGVTIDSDPRALAILHEWVETTGAELVENRLRAALVSQRIIPTSANGTGRAARP
jgi:molybdopterin-biosynthesis enzyme MoeA-like protein